MLVVYKKMKPFYSVRVWINTHRDPQLVSAISRRFNCLLTVEQRKVCFSSVLKFYDLLGRN